MGITSPLEANLSLALGSSVISVLDQASGYETIANQGVHVNPSALRLVKDSLGNTVLDDQYPQATEVVSAGTAYIMTSMMEDVINHGTGYPNAVIGRPAAGKTGTTSDFRDAWFVGFTPDLVTAVWLGNDDYKRMNESYGGNIPARIWARFMKAALAKVPKHDFAFPEDEVTLCGHEYYLNGTEPVSGCGTGRHVDTAAAPASTLDPQSGALPSTSPPPTLKADPSVSPNATQPPNSVGDGTVYENLDSASPTPRPHRR
jgi:penicillin-binding protein 1A